MYGCLVQPSHSGKLRFVNGVQAREASNDAAVSKPSEMATVDLQDKTAAIQAAILYVTTLMAEDRKSTALKALQVNAPPPLLPFPMFQWNEVSDCPPEMLSSRLHVLRFDLPYSTLLVEIVPVFIAFTSFRADHTIIFQKPCMHQAVP